MAYKRVCKNQKSSAFVPYERAIKIHLYGLKAIKQCYGVKKQWGKAYKLFFVKIQFAAHKRQMKTAEWYKIFENIHKTVWNKRPDFMRMKTIKTMAECFCKNLFLVRFVKGYKIEMGFA